MDKLVKLRKSLSKRFSGEETDLLAEMLFLAADKGVIKAEDEEGVLLAYNEKLLVPEYPAT